MKVVILGAGPAGLACAYELNRQGVAHAVYELDRQVGGMAKTFRYQEFHLDLGPHRFFSPIARINAMWTEVLGDDIRTIPRLTRIFYRNRFFYYPLKPFNAFFNLGPLRTLQALASYAWVKLFPSGREDNFQEWVSNHFGPTLFNIFFKTYTEKVWGIPCTEIGAEWASQRIKGLSLSVAIKSAFSRKSARGVKTLVDEFTYPRLGTGMFYEKIERLVNEGHGAVHKGHEVVRIHHDGTTVQAVTVRDARGVEARVEGTHFVSSMPLTQLIKRMDPPAPPDVLQAAERLRFRNTLLVYLVINQKDLFRDNWIYVHSPEVQMGRITNFGNWSPEMMPNERQTVLCLEYWCFAEDAIWSRSEAELVELAKKEIVQIGLCRPEDIAEGFLKRVPRSYPVYFLGYRDHLDVLIRYLKPFENMQEIGRYGAYKYNNQDHSLLMGYLSARNILGEHHDIWDVNTDSDYQEGAQALEVTVPAASTAPSGTPG